MGEIEAPIDALELEVDGNELTAIEAAELPAFIIQPPLPPEAADRASGPRGLAQRLMLETWRDLETITGRFCASSLKQRREIRRWVNRTKPCVMDFELVCALVGVPLSIGQRVFRQKIEDSEKPVALSIVRSRSVII